MSEARRFFVFCEDNCKFEGMTKEQIITAIAEATGKTPQDIDAAFITKIKEQNADKPVKVWVGTQAEYNALQSIDADTLYFFDDDELANIEESLANAQESIENIISGETVVGKAKNANNAANAGKVNNLEITRDENGVLKIGDIVIPQRKKLWSGEVSSDSGDASVTLNEKINNNDIIEIDCALKNSSVGAIERRTIRLCGNYADFGTLTYKYENERYVQTRTVEIKREQGDTTKLTIGKWITVEISGEIGKAPSSLASSETDTVVYAVYKVIE